MSFSIEWARSAAREIRTLPFDAGLRVASSIGELANDPRPSGCKKLSGFKDFWRIRISQYRVIDSIGDAVKVVRIERISHRIDVYR